MTMICTNLFRGIVATEMKRANALDTPPPLSPPRAQGAWSCENPETLAHDLKSALQFEGFVMSDWGATHSTAAAIRAGQHMEMPGGAFFTQDKLRGALANGKCTSCPKGVCDAATCSAGFSGKTCEVEARCPVERLDRTFVVTAPTALVNRRQQVVWVWPTSER